MVAQFERRIAELEQQLSQREQQKASNREKELISLKLRWREGRAPCKMYRCSDAVVEGNVVYVRKASTVEIYSYDATSDSWSQLPHCIHEGGPIAIINGLLTTIGGGSFFTLSNELFSLTGEGRGRRWTKKFPPMPTWRKLMTALCTGATLIVAGGTGVGGRVLSTVEVMNTETHQWSTAADLPQPMCIASVTVCGDQLYMLGGFTQNVTATKVVYTCSVRILLQSCVRYPQEGAALIDEVSIWRRITDLPVTASTCEFFHGRLLVIGGHTGLLKHSTAIYIYNSTTNSWEIISHMTTGRRCCFTAVLPDNQLMVVGGSIDGDETDSVELANAGGSGNEEEFEELRQRFEMLKRSINRK